MNRTALFLAPLVLTGLAMAQSGQAPTPSTKADVQGKEVTGTNRPGRDPKLIRRNPAYRAGHKRGFQQGANDSAANSNSYNDEVSPEVTMDGYSAQYGEPERYRELFRLGYIAGYKEGWDYNAGRYCATCAR